MKIGIAQLNFKVGDFDHNVNAMIQAIRKGEKEGAGVMIFSELSVCGYPPHDLFEKKAFFESCEGAVKRIAEETGNIDVILGAPSLNPEPKGKNLFNSAYYISGKTIKDVYHKGLLPTYDIFDEYRYFEPCHTFSTIRMKKYNVAVTICEDLWFDQPVTGQFGKSMLYQTAPMDELAKQHPDFIINLSASPFAFNKSEAKRDIFTQTAKKYGLPLFMANQVGANTELLFEGGSMVIGPKGNLYDEMDYFTEDIRFYEVGKVKSENPAFHPVDYKPVPLIHDALVMGIRDYFSKSGFSKATLGLSGGIDSAVTLALAAEALGKENIRVLLMPSKYSSGHSIDDARKLAENVQVPYDIVSIEPVTEAFKNSLKPLFRDLPEDVTEENIQARARAVLLMAISNKFGHILLNTSNKSEAAVGYGTLYGDMSGGLSVLGDVYKTQVYELARYINRDREIIPENTIMKPPSAELRPDQKDADSLPGYDILDQILFRYIEQHYSVEDIIRSGFPGDVVKKAVRLVDTNEYKRYQAPPVLRISSKAFGMGRKMPIVAKY